MHKSYYLKKHHKVEGCKFEMTATVFLDVRSLAVKTQTLSLSNTFETTIKNVWFDVCPSVQSLLNENNNNNEWMNECMHACMHEWMK